MKTARCGGASSARSSISSTSSAESAERTTQRIRADGIDILIDLNGYTSGSRVEIFVPGAAPMQMHWLGFLGTQGAEWFDYIITDRFAAPPAMQPYFTERFLYLDCYTPSDTRRAIDPETPPRAAHGLPEDAIVFCCFNNAYKILPPVFDAWMRILARGSAAACCGFRRRRTRPTPICAARQRARGIAPERLIFAPRVDLGAYLARLRLADLFLDTWPYNAGTTANDALLVGLPLLTCTGETLASRVAASQLRDDGRARARHRRSRRVRAPRDRARARTGASSIALRKKLGRARASSLLFDMERYTRRFEDALAAAWDDYERTSATATS